MSVVSVLGLRPYGDAALLVEVADAAAALALRRALVASPPAGLVDLVPAARTLLVRVRPGTDLGLVASAVGAVEPWPADGSDAAPAAGVELPVVYDGEDLDEVARLTGLSTREVVAAHTGCTWTVAFAGFAPGFGYLEATGPTPARLTVPRRADPRTAVPAGAVALAGDHCGVYPRVSPGGWQLIGRTDRPTWLPDRDPPAVLVPGVVVRFTERAS